MTETLLYSPAVEVHISTAAHGIIDVTADLTQGSLTLAENALANFTFALNNHRRKYDGLFTPNDRIVVRMKRIRWVQVMAGYLGEVPFFSVYPRVVQLTASCTLKKLMYRPWDPGSDAAYQLLSTTATGNQGATQVDGGIREKLVTLLTQVGDWPQQHIHLGQIPKNWFSTVTNLSAEVAAATAQTGLNLGTAPVFAGAATSSGTLTPPAGSPNFMCALPAASGLCSSFGGPNDASTRGGHMALTGEAGESPHDNWYCAMRWGYYAMDSDGKGHHPVGTSAQQDAAITWLRNRKLVVSNPQNGRAVVVRAADWGPGGMVDANARVIDLSPQALTSLGVNTDGHVDIRWAPTQNLPLGPTTAAKVAQAATGTSSGTAARNAATAAAAQSKMDRLDGGTGDTSSLDSGQPKPTASLPFTKTPDNGGYLMPQTHAAKVFIEKNWPWVTHIGGYAPGTGHIAHSDHYTGRALDVVISPGNRMPTPAEMARGNSIALWFAMNPHVFGTRIILYRGREILQGTGWKAITEEPPGISSQHWDHVHISFTQDLTAPGPMGNGWSTVNDPFFTKYGVSTPGGQGFIPAGDPNAAAGDSTGDGSAGGASGQGNNNLLNAFNWYGSPDPSSSILSGPRVLMNDTPLLTTVQQLCQAGMRSYMAAPNGDFIGWFPDYFDNYQIAGKLHIADIELMNDGFTIQWSDANLVTHQFTAGAPTGYSQGSAPGEAVDIYAEAQTQGIVTVEFPKIMQALFNIDPKSPEASKFLDSAGILNRYGARPDFQSLGTITGPQAEFWYALSLFQRNWASQFSSSIETTFMPEAWPGMLVVIDSFKFQAYITSVTHSFNFSDGGGFTTAINVIAPSSLDGGGLYGLPRGGGTAAAPKKKPVKVVPKKALHG